MPAPRPTTRPTRGPGLVAALLLLCDAWLTGCGGAPEGPPPTITIVGTEWAGTPGATPRTRTWTLPALKGQSVTLSADTADAVTVTVSAVRRSEVTFTTSEKMAPRGASGGIDLNDLRTRFTVGRDQPVRFATPTMDAGTGYEVSLAG